MVLESERRDPVFHLVASLDQWDDHVNEHQRDERLMYWDLEKVELDYRRTHNDHQHE